MAGREMVDAFFENVREEYRLPEEQLHHVRWLVNAGLLNLTDVRTMLARRAGGSLLDRHGADATTWPRRAAPIFQSGSSTSRSCMAMSRSALLEKSHGSIVSLRYRRSETLNPVMFGFRRPR